MHQHEIFPTLECCLKVKREEDGDLNLLHWNVSGKVWLAHFCFLMR